MSRIFLLFLVTTFIRTAVGFDELDFQPGDVITRDVVVLGGGASGTFATVRLREDFNISVLVVESQDHLGGHVNTYIDPITNSSIDYGVQTYIRYGNSVAFFNRFNLSVVPFSPKRLTSVDVDISTGEPLESYIPPSRNQTIAAFEIWLNLTSKYSALMLPGYWNFPAGDAIPDELLLPFGDFANHYDIRAAVPTIMAISNVGVGGIEDVLTLYVMHAFGQPITKDYLQGSMFVPEGENNMALYERALTALRKDVLLQTEVIAAERSEHGVKLITQSKSGGGKKLIKAKCLLITPPPSHENLQNLDLDSRETSVFSTWTPTWSFAGIVHIPFINGFYSINYISSSASPANYLALRDWPWTLRLDSTGPTSSNLFRVLFSTNYSISHEEAKTLISAAILNVTSLEGPLSNNSTVQEIQYLAFVDHNSVLWRHSAVQLRQGFVKDLYGLQGHRATWYTGELWTEDYTGNVWAFTDTVLPKMIDGI